MLFIKHHWFLILLVLLALASAIVCIFAPLAAIGSLTLTLAATPAFTALGIFAIPTAQSIIALTAAATVFAIGGITKGMGMLIDWAVGLCCRKNTAHDKQPILTSQNNDESEDTTSNPSHPATPRSNSQDPRFFNGAKHPTLSVNHCLNQIMPISEIYYHPPSP
jgi:hypothetical protein